MGRFAAVTSRTVTLLLAAKAKPASAEAASLTWPGDPGGPKPGPGPGTGPPISSRQFKNKAGVVDTVTLLENIRSSRVATNAIGPIDGVGLCLAAIKELTARLNALDSRSSALG